MNETSNLSLRLAILDMYEGAENQGIRCLRELITAFAESAQIDIQIAEFEIRQRQEMPGPEFDIYIASGGPGDPFEATGQPWFHSFTELMQQIEQFNAIPLNKSKKQVMFICYSFQLACLHFQVGQLSKRKSTSFGIFPVHPVASSRNEPIFLGLGDPFYVFDNRDFQLIQLNHKQLAEIGATILAIEKMRLHVPLERAIMAMRFNENMIGTQFHPEADAKEMTAHLRMPERKESIIKNHGTEKWQSMIDLLNENDKIMQTYNHIIPNFLQLSIKKMISSTIS